MCPYLKNSLNYRFDEVEFRSADNEEAGTDEVTLDVFFERSCTNSK